MIELKRKPSDRTRISACCWQIRVRPDTLLHLRKHFCLEDIKFRNDSGSVGVVVMVMFLLCGRIAHPFGHRRKPIPLRWHQTCQSETKRAERTNKPRTGVASPTHLRTATCARFFKQNEREHNTNKKKTRLPIKSAHFATVRLTMFSQNRGHEGFLWSCEGHVPHRSACYAFEVDTEKRMYQRMPTHVDKKMLLITRVSSARITQRTELDLSFLIKKKEISIVSI